MTGWDVDFLQQAVDTCTNLSGLVEDCPIFTLQSEDKMKECSMKLPKVLVNEKVAGKVGNTLPGGVPIQYGPGPATVANPGPQTTHQSIDTVGYSEGAKPTDSVYLPGQVFKDHTSSAAEPAPTPSTADTPEFAAAAQPAITPPPASQPVEEEGYEVVRTEYVTEGKLVNMIIVKEKVEYVTMTTTTATSTVTVEGIQARYEPHMHRHGRRHVHGRRS